MFCFELNPKTSAKYPLRPLLVATNLTRHKEVFLQSQSPQTSFRLPGVAIAASKRNPIFTFVAQAGDGDAHSSSSNLVPALTADGNPNRISQAFQD